MFDDIRGIILNTQDPAGLTGVWNERLPLSYAFNYILIYYRNHVFKHRY